jgi:hypothetical protein
MNKPLASRSILTVKANGERLTVMLPIGQPYEVTPEEWATSVSISGLHSRLGDIHGNDAWQVIQLAYELIAQLIGHFVEEGGTLYWAETGEPMELDELLPRAVVLPNVPRRLLDSRREIIDLQRDGSKPTRARAPGLGTRLDSTRLLLRFRMQQCQVQGTR